ncbi:cyclic nucleotide-binding domain-containing protein [Actinomadura darangshiensis]|uniref:cyclic nucleotide-binding domain-containing protein n=1 Tax=Actinomadura darangshiensis TaxID=705336 RepID=UPI00140E8B7B|nr:cyclic nucleotide-binding domain-containing protein [Actinomadura darangshiensis]
MNEHARHHDPDQITPAEVVPQQRNVPQAETVPQAEDALPAQTVRQPAPARRSGFWPGLTTIERAAFLASAQEIVYPAGTVLWTEDQVADHTIVIKAGSVRVCVERDGRERFIAFRGPGDIIGERAALLLRTRSATVVAMERLHALRMTTREFVTYLSDHPRVVAVLEREMYDRLTEQHGPGQPPQRVHYPAGATHPYGPAAQYGTPRPYASAHVPVLPQYPYAMTGPFTVADPYSTAGGYAVPDPYNTYAVADPYAAAGPYAMAGPYAVPGPYGTPDPRAGGSAFRMEPPAAPAPVPSAPTRAVPTRAERAARSIAAVVEPSLDQPTQPMAVPGRGGASWAGANCTIVYTDVAGFSSPARNDADRLGVRRAMYNALQEAFDDSDVPWDDCHVEDRGDGALIVLPPEVPTAAVIDPMFVSLGTRLRRHNHRSSGAVRVQLRVAVNVGPVMTETDPAGVSGWSIITAARLLDAPPLKQRLAATGADLGVIASRFVYDSVIVPSPGPVRAAEYERISCRVKESRLEGWIHLYGVPARPAG